MTQLQPRAKHRKPAKRASGRLDQSVNRLSPHRASTHGMPPANDVSGAGCGALARCYPPAGMISGKGTKRSVKGKRGSLSAPSRQQLRRRTNAFRASSTQRTELAKIAQAI